MRLDNLTDGTKFEIVGSEKAYRNLRVVSVTNCAVLIEGDHTDLPFSESPEWKRIRYEVSCATDVKRL